MTPKIMLLNNFKSLRKTNINIIDSISKNIFIYNSIYLCCNKYVNVFITQNFESKQCYKLQYSSIALEFNNTNKRLVLNTNNNLKSILTKSLDLMYFNNVFNYQISFFTDRFTVPVFGYKIDLPNSSVNFKPENPYYQRYVAYKVYLETSEFMENSSEQVYDILTWYKCISGAIPFFQGDP